MVSPAIWIRPGLENSPVRTPRKHAGQKEAGWKKRGVRTMYDVRRRGLLGELVLYLTTHQRRVNAHLPTVGVAVCRQRKQSCGEKVVETAFPFRKRGLLLRERNGVEGRKSESI